MPLRGRVRGWLAILSLLIIAPHWDGAARLDLLGDDPRITATPVPLDPGDPARLRIGALTYLGGVTLKSPDPVFGGFSAMHLAGDRFTLLSDGGNVVRFRLGADWKPRDIRFAELPNGPGTGWPKSDRDSESLLIDPANGDALVGFESTNQIWRYDRTLRRAIRHAGPAAMKDWSPNSGAESMVRTASGTTIVIAERGEEYSSPGRIALSFTGDPTVQPNRGFRFVYLPPVGYDPSDAALLPDGRILVLNRRFALPFVFSVKLTVVDPRAIRRGARVSGVEIATIGAPLTHDNFEGLAIARQGAATIVWLVSDDNLFFLERTLLMKFRLDLPGRDKRQRPAPRIRSGPSSR